MEVNAGQNTKFTLIKRLHLNKRVKFFSSFFSEFEFNSIHETCFLQSSQ